MPRHIHADVIHAWADGADIQYLRLDGVWDDISFPPLNESNEYRIKPRTVKREGWVAIYKRADGLSYLHTGIYDFEDDAKQNCPQAVSIIKVEWEEAVPVSIVPYYPLAGVVTKVKDHSSHE